MLSIDQPVLNCHGDTNGNIKAYLCPNSCFQDLSACFILHPAALVAERTEQKLAHENPTRVQSEGGRYEGCRCRWMKDQTPCIIIRRLHVPQHPQKADFTPVTTSSLQASRSVNTPSSVVHHGEGGLRRFDVVETRFPIEQNNKTSRRLDHV